MSGFISNVISRHIEPGKNITPRLPGRFEPIDNVIGKQPDDNIATNHDIPGQIPGIGPADKDNPVNDESDVIKVNRHLPVKNENSLPSVPPVSFTANAEDKIQRVPVKTEQHPEVIPVITARGDLQADSPDLQNPDQGFHNAVNSGIITPEENQSLHLGFKEITMEGEEKVKVHEQKWDHYNTSIPDENVNAAHFSEKRQLMETSEKSDGAFGEPPGATYTSADSSKQGMTGYQLSLDPSPIIKVSIGQITVRAVIPAVPVTVQKPGVVHKPALTLEDYLKQRNKK